MFGWIVSHPWAYPALEVLHINGIGLLLGSLVLLELRVWGLGRALPLPALAGLALPVTLAGFGLAAASGLLMFAGQAVELLGQRLFTLKMLLIAVLGCNAAVFHARGALQHPDAWARLQTALSLGGWLVVIVLGRWLGYV
ncbi:hypothetical protein [Aquabacterium sp. OR-4]|uniref:hypothetical protein n=1 Tax=Aquabacterium sp. OR-4 TaxID=2978127 RepID=UPI0021B1AEF1|nr:hypothetical protein [Aquabacterium sp. OR-4]MDT7834404.1 hypothetical protein [Aquabacterium sp. OR-4]